MSIGIDFKTWESIYTTLRDRVKNRDLIRLWGKLRVPRSWNWNNDEYARKSFMSLESDQIYQQELQELVDKIDFKYRFK